MADELVVSPGDLPEVIYRSYPWEQWMNGNVWTVRLGEDFDADPRSFRSYLYRKARSSKVAVSIVVLSGSEVRFKFRSAGSHPVILPGAPPRGRPRVDVDPELAARAAAFRAERAEEERNGPSSEVPEWRRRIDVEAARRDKAAAEALAAPADAVQQPSGPPAWPAVPPWVPGAGGG